MKRTKFGKHFLGTTRGRIVNLVRGTTKTVNELAEQLELTDNAVRAHLLSLERDGLIKQSGLRRGVRKPHFAYELTSEAESIFPKAYDELLNQLITVLKGRFTSQKLNELLREVGRSLPGNRTSGGNLETRVNRGLMALEGIGGAARVEKEGGKFFIRSGSCPLATAVVQHPEVCQLAESLLSEVIGTKVREQCDRQGSPRCAFEIVSKN